MKTHALGPIAATLAVAGALLAGRLDHAPEPPLEGKEPWGTALVPAVEAAFEHESYRPGDRALLRVADRADSLALQVFQSGPEHVATTSNTFMRGVPVSRERTVTGGGGRRLLSLPIGRWESGFYYARLRAPDGRLGFAPFVVAPRRLGEHRVAVVLPTLTWQAYNFRDDDGNGRADTWYARPDVTSVGLGRAFLDRGVPYGFRNHLAFLNWLYRTRRSVDFLSQRDLEQAESARALARAYDLIVFEGHHEYVTAREYDVIEGYRDLGGNLLFLSANNFFWRVERRGAVLERIGRWRRLGRPEAALVGVQYVAHQRSPRGGWIVRATRDRSWIFAGTGLGTGSRFARGGVEIDQVTSASPRGVRVVAEIPDLFGPGLSGQMSYYETPEGARVFAAGAFHLTRAVTSDPIVWRILENIWARLAEP